MNTLGCYPRLYRAILTAAAHLEGLAAIRVSVNDDGMIIAVEMDFYVINTDGTLTSRSVARRFSTLLDREFDGARAMTVTDVFQSLMEEIGGRPRYQPS